MKKTFTVEIPEIWKRSFTIEATSEEEAKEKANRLIESGDQEGAFEYSDTLDLDEWYVQDITDQFKIISDNILRK